VQQHGAVPNGTALLLRLYRLGLWRVDLEEKMGVRRVPCCL